MKVSRSMLGRLGGAFSVNLIAWGSHREGSASALPSPGGCRRCCRHCQPAAGSSSLGQTAPLLHPCTDGLHRTASACHGSGKHGRQAGRGAGKPGMTCFVGAAPLRSACSAARLA